jgi:hypothetical protein
MNEFTRALTPPFIGRRRDFTFRKHPRARRIFLMWTHTRMSFSTHTFTSLPLVHTLNPDFLGRQLWLCFSLVREFSVRDFRSSWLCRFEIPDFRMFMTSRLCRFKTPENRMFVTPRLRRPKIPENHLFATLRLRKPKIPENRLFATLRLRRPKIPENRLFATPRLRRPKIPENRMCPAPEKHISRTSLNSTFRGWRVFLNSPTWTSCDVYVLSI